MTKKLVHQKITILNVYAFNNRAPKQIKHKSIRLQEKIDNSTTVGRYFNSLSLIIVRTWSQKISNDRKNLNHNYQKTNINDIYKTPNNIRIHILFKCT